MSSSIIRIAKRIDHNHHDGVAKALTRIFHTSLRGEPLLSLTPRFSGVIAAAWRTELFQQFQPS
jgi:hypothetical protein